MNTRRSSAAKSAAEAEEVDAWSSGRGGRERARARPLDGAAAQLPASRSPTVVDVRCPAVDEVVQDLGLVEAVQDARRAAQPAHAGRPPGQGLDAVEDGLGEGDLWEDERHPRQRHHVLHGGRQLQGGVADQLVGGLGQDAALGALGAHVDGQRRHLGAQVAHAVEALGAAAAAQEVALARAGVARGGGVLLEEQEEALGHGEEALEDGAGLQVGVVRPEPVPEIMIVDHHDPRNGRVRGADVRLREGLDVVAQVEGGGLRLQRRRPGSRQLGLAAGRSRRARVQPALRAKRTQTTPAHPTPGSSNPHGRA